MKCILICQRRLQRLELGGFAGNPSLNLATWCLRCCINQMSLPERRSRAQSEAGRRVTESQRTRGASIWLVGNFSLFAETDTKRRQRIPLACIRTGHTHTHMSGSKELLCWHWQPASYLKAAASPCGSRQRFQFLIYRTRHACVHVCVYGRVYVCIGAWPNENVAQFVLLKRFSCAKLSSCCCSPWRNWLHWCANSSHCPLCASVPLFACPDCHSLGHFGMKSPRYKCHWFEAAKSVAQFSAPAADPHRVSSSSSPSLIISFIIPLHDQSMSACM